VQLSDEIRRARVARRLSQPEAARELGVSLRTYQRWESGEPDGFAARFDRILTWLRGVAP
jgi:transcriptional regulator with XRE-family HTH domain